MSDMFLLGITYPDRRILDWPGMAARRTLSHYRIIPNLNTVPFSVGLPSSSAQHCFPDRICPHLTGSNQPDCFQGRHFAS